MIVTLKQEKTADGKRRYVATVKSGKRKGKTYAATVHDSGHGFRVFWDHLEREMGGRCEVQ